MRVAFLTHFYPPEVGAPQKRISALARGLAEAGLRVQVHTCFPHYPRGRVIPPYRLRPSMVEQDGPVRVVRSFTFPAPNRGFARRLLDHASFGLSALAGSRQTAAVDIVCAETPPLFLARAAGPYARLKNAKLVLHVSDLWPDSAVELGALRSPPLIRAARRLERACYRSADAIVCPTEGIRDALAVLPEASGKVRVIRPSVELAEFDPGPSPEVGPFKVLYAGTVGLAQGVGTLVEASRLVPRSPTVKVIVAGDGAERPEVARAAVNRPNLELRGAVTHPEVVELYRGTHAAVVLLRDRPLLRGALPTKIFEAMAAGRPVILSGGGEAARLLAESEAGVTVPPEDPSALAEAISELAGDRERCVRLGAAGRAFVERGFGRERARHEWLRLLDELGEAEQPG